MALRIASAGNIIGLTEAEVLCFAAALTSTGVPAEGRGSVISRLLIRIETAVRYGPWPVPPTEPDEASNIHRLAQDFVHQLQPGVVCNPDVTLS